MTTISTHAHTPSRPLLLFFFKFVIAIFWYSIFNTTSLYLVVPSSAEENIPPLGGGVYKLTWHTM